MENLFRITLRNMVMPKSASLFLCSLIFSSYIHAIDNPDAPNYVEEFQTRMTEFEKKSVIEKPTTHDDVTYYLEYLAILDKELNNAYSDILLALPDNSKEQLRISQRNWIKFRDSEFSFIEQHWTRDNFGTSYIISIGDYKVSILKSRIVQLLHYLKST